MIIEQKKRSKEAQLVQGADAAHQLITDTPFARNTGVMMPNVQLPSNDDEYSPDEFSCYERMTRFDPDVLILLIANEHIVAATGGTTWNWLTGTVKLRGASYYVLPGEIHEAMQPVATGGRIAFECPIDSEVRQLELLVEPPANDGNCSTVWIRDVTNARHGQMVRAACQAARNRLEPLSKREVEVLDLLADGMPNKLVAAHLNLSRRTIEKHRARITRKLSLSIHEAITIRALKTLLDPEDKPPTQDRKSA